MKEEKRAKKRSEGENGGKKPHMIRVEEVYWQRFVDLGEELEARNLGILFRDMLREYCKKQKVECP